MTRNGILKVVIAIAYAGALAWLSIFLLDVIGAAKILEWSKAMAVLSFGWAGMLTLVMKLPSRSDYEFLPEWEEIVFSRSVSRLRGQLWFCFYYLFLAAVEGICAIFFTNVSFENSIAAVTLFLGFSSLGLIFLIPALWGSVSAACSYVASRSKVERERMEELNGLLKAMQSPMDLGDKFQGYSNRAGQADKPSDPDKPKPKGSKQ